MSIKSAPFYWLVCDKCGERADYDEFTAYDTQGAAIDMAQEWETVGDKHYCLPCSRNLDLDDDGALS